MSGKVIFGADFIHIIAEINARNMEGSHRLIGALRGILLVQWGLSIEEIDESTSLFLKRMKEESIDDLYICMQRLLKFTQSKQVLKEKLLIHIATVVFLNENITEGERILLDAFADLLDFRPSEAKALYSKAIDLKVALQMLAEVYEK